MRVTPYLPPAARRASLRGRAVVAVLLLAGFYTLALAVAGVMISVIVLQVASGEVSLKLTLVAGMAAIAILVGIFPRPDRFETPWPRLRPEEQPELFRHLHAIAAQAQQPLPGEVYLVPELNAWVANRGGVMGFGSRRVMGIGLPLLHLLDVSQLSAVLAHEFGHYHGGDTALGPWVYKTRGAIGRTLHNLGESGWSLLRVPFEWYGRMFLRVTHAISRQQEYTADRFAARIAGPQALREALQRLAGYGPGVTTYWNALVLPALGAGYRPPIRDGLERMLASTELARMAEAHAEQCIRAEEEDPLSTHPPLRDRIAALETLPPADAQERQRAIALLRNTDELERLLLGTFLRADALFGLKEIPWCDVGDRVFLANWSAWRARNRKALGTWTVERIPEFVGNAGVIADDLVDVDGKAPGPGERVGYVCDVLTSCLAMALVDAGWEFTAEPSVGLRFRRGEDTADPSALVYALATGQIDANRWNGMCSEMGLRDAPLAGAARPAPEPVLPAGTRATRRIAVYRIRVDESGAPLELITLLSPDDTYRIGGLPPETVVGKLLTPGAEMSTTNFVRNPAFTDFMHAVIERAVPEIADYREAARKVRDGWLEVSDMRAQGNQGDGVARDFIGRFLVVGGDILPDSYVPNPDHRIVNELGMFAPHPEIQEHLLAALRALRHDPGAPGSVPQS